jgi:hypothetical protein
MTMLADPAGIACSATGGVWRPWTLPDGAPRNARRDPI